jgi:Zn-dependent peptidase ImmA (M78 family)/transcriptional regulator with XRE-family HTH domain
MADRYNHSMVTLARDSRSLTQTELAIRLGIPQGTVSKIESGAMLIPQELIEKISRELDYPEAFFLQTDAVYPFGSSTFYHRKLQSVTTGVLRKIEAKVNIYRFHITRLLRATDLDARCAFRHVDAGEHDGRIEEISRLTRAAWKIPAGPIENMVAVIENAGGIVVRFDFGTSKMSGLSEWIPPVPPLFFLNDNPQMSADRDRFTLAHELGHVLLHAQPNAKMEREADRFAAEFLAPARDVRPHLNAPIRLHTLGKLKPHWRMSMAALLQRAKDLRVINDHQFRYLRIQLGQHGYRLREPPQLDVPREYPSLLNEIIAEHVNTLGFGHSELAKMVNMNPQEFAAYHQLNTNRAGLRLVSAS